LVNKLIIIILLLEIVLSLILGSLAMYKNLNHLKHMEYLEMGD